MASRAPRARMRPSITACRAAATSLLCLAGFTTLVGAQDAPQARPETPSARPESPTPASLLEPVGRSDSTTRPRSGPGLTAEPSAGSSALPADGAFAGEIPEISFEQTLAAFGTVRRWVDEGGVPSLDGTPLPRARIASIILRNAEGVMGQHTVVARTADDTSDTIRRAATKAIQRAVNRLQGPPDALRRSRIATGLAGVRLSLEISTGEPVPVAEGISAGELDQWLRPGLEGMLLSRDGAARARTPAGMLASGLPASATLVTLVAELADDPAVALAPFEQLADSGYALSFFRVRHAAQTSPGAPPLVLHRGGAVAPPVRTSDLAALADSMSAHIRGRAWPGVERLGLRGDLDPVTGTFARGAASPFAQAVAAEALLRYTGVPGGNPTETARARAAAEATLAALAVVEGQERAPWGDAVTASACLNALARMDRSAIEGSDELRGLRERCVPAVAQAFEKKDGFHTMIPASARGVVARAMVSLAGFEPWDRDDHLERAGLAIRLAYREAPDSQLLNLMPDLAWADLELASLRGVEPPSASSLRALRARVLERQLGRSDLIGADRDLVGGFVLDVGGNPLPTWQSARPTAMLATMLGEPSLTRGSLAAGEVAPELLNLSAALRFIKQLTADERAAHMYADPGLAVGGVRSSLWDQEMSLTASALGLIAVTESLESLDAIVGRAGPEAGRP